MIFGQITETTPSILRRFGSGRGVLATQRRHAPPSRLSARSKYGSTCLRSIEGVFGRTSSADCLPCALSSPLTHAHEARPDNRMGMLHTPTGPHLIAVAFRAAITSA
jgi:hypothetical protein